MRRLATVLLLAAALSACGGSDAASPPVTIRTATRPAAATQLSNPTQVSSGGTASPIPATATPSATSIPAETTTAATTPQATSAPTQPAAPTPTPGPSGGLPLSATMGVTGTARYFWSPGQVTIAAGGSVTFTWSGAAAHDVTVPALGFETPGSPKPEGTYTVTFPAAGTFEVICVIHSATMRGKVIVQ